MGYTDYEIHQRGTSESGQTTVEWTGLVALVSILFLALLLAGSTIPGGGLARLIAKKLVCATAMSAACEVDPQLYFAYGDEIATDIRAHAPSIAYEDGSTGLPVDFRRCRSTSCADGPEDGRVTRSNSGLPVSTYVHVVDCRLWKMAATAAVGGDCSGDRAGHLYLQYWLYYANSQTYAGVPVAAKLGYHDDDWEGVQIRVNPDGTADVRASSHHGYNYENSAKNWGSDIGEVDLGPVKLGFLTEATEAIGLRPKGGWGDETGWLYVSGGSHAGNAKEDRDPNRYTPSKGLTIIPLDDEVLQDGAPEFAISPPWRKHVWSDPEAGDTG